MAITTDETDRKLGLIFRDPAHASAPATHVLIVGVGAYASPKLGAVTSPPISARALATWFLDGALERNQLGFRNPARPLGSLAILLSEPGETPSLVEGATAPSAAYDACADAAWAWVERANTNRENLLVLYLCGHGEAFEGKTAFLLQDSWTRPGRVTHGMVKIEQLLGALSMAIPIDQLVMVDCCRLPTGLPLPAGDDFGAPLLSLTKAVDDHGHTRRQWLIASSSLGEEAVGRKNKTTLFAHCLLTALNGVASDVAQTDWAVRPSLLLDRIQDLLSLHGRPGERTQTPSSRGGGGFDITLPGETNRVRTYFSLVEGCEWPGVEIEIKQGATPTLRLQGPTPGYAFAEIELEGFRPTTVKASRQGVSLGSTSFRAMPPYRRVPIGGQPAARVEVHAGKGAGAITRGDGQESSIYRSPGGTRRGGRPVGGAGGRQAGTLWIKTTGSAVLKDGLIARIVRHDPGSKAAVVILAADAGGRETSVPLDAGIYSVTVVTADQNVVEQDVEILTATSTELEIRIQESPHEWLQYAVATGAVSFRTEPPPTTVPNFAAVDSIRRSLASDLSHGFSTAALGDELDRRLLVKPVVATVGANPHSLLASVGLDTVIDSTDVGVHLTPGEFDERFQVANVSDPRRGRWSPQFAQPRIGQAHQNPPWAVAAGEGWVELAVIPSLGAEGAYERDETGAPDAWAPKLLLDRRSGGRSHVVPIVESRRWAALLAFLGSRDFERSGALFDALLANAVLRSSVMQKLENPYAASAAALVAVAADRLASADIPEGWLLNLANWFPGLPDGAVILARHRLIRARTEAEIGEARRLFLEGYRRGRPVFSLACDWLAEGLTAAAGGDKTVSAAADEAGRWAAGLDRSRVFTVFRLYSEHA